MLKKPQRKRELIKLLQEIDDFNVLMIHYGDKKDVLQRLSKLQVMREIAVIVIGVH